MDERRALRSTPPGRSGCQRRFLRQHPFGLRGDRRVETGGRWIRALVLQLLDLQGPYGIYLEDLVRPQPMPTAARDRPFLQHLAGRCVARDSAGSNGGCSTGTSRRSASTAPIGAVADGRRGLCSVYQARTSSTGAAHDPSPHPRRRRRRERGHRPGQSAALAAEDRSRRFRRLTMGKPMIMGRKTFQSIGKPLPGARRSF